MLWQIRGTNTFLLGSMHQSNRRLDWAGNVQTILDRSDTFMFEADFSLALPAKFGKYSSATALSKHIPSTLFADTRSLWMSLGLDEYELERCRPWWAALCIVNAFLPKRGFSPALGIDGSLLIYGKQNHKTIQHFESITAGLDGIGNAPQAEQEKFLSHSVSRLEEGLQILETMVSAWEDWQPERLLPIVEQYLQLFPTIYGGLLAKRNKKWLSKLLRLVNSNAKATVIVGALHFVGPDNLLTLLKDNAFDCDHLQK